MKAKRFACVACLSLLATSAGCHRDKPGAENLRRGQDLVATKPVEAIQEYQRAGKAGADALEVKKGVAAAHERLKEFDKATVLLREVLAQKPDDLDARLALVRIELLQQHLDAALVQLESILSLKSPHAPSLLLYAALARTPVQGKSGLQALDRLDKKSFAPLLGSAEYAFARASLVAASGDAAGADAILVEAAATKSMGPSLALTVANASRIANRPRFAEWLLARASQTEGAPEAVHEALAELALSQRHLTLAKEAISKLRTEFKPDPKALLLLAQYYELHNEPAERAKVTRRALDAVPEQDEAERRRVALIHAVALERAGNLKEAVEFLTGLLERYPGFPPGQLLLANLCLGLKDYDQAIQLGELLVKNEQLSSDGYQILVAAYQLKKAPAQAETAARRYVQASSHSATSIMLLVNVLAQDKRPEMALQEVEAGLARYPNELELLKARIALTERVSGFAKAEALAIEAARGKSPKVLRELAQLYERNKRFERALAIYTELTVLEPKAFADLSALQDRMGNLSEALTSMRALVQAEPYNVKALLRLGMLEERAGRADAARDAYERVLVIEGDSVLALNNLSMLLTAVPGKSQRAVELARRAQTLARDDVRVADTLGWALVQNGDPNDHREAIQLLERSAGELRSPESNYHYGAALAAAGQNAQAAAVLAQAIGAKGEFPWRAQAAKLSDEVRRRSAAPAPQP